MFSFNHSCEFCWIDWDELTNPVEICDAILEHTDAVLIILGAETAANYALFHEGTAKGNRITARESTYADEDRLRAALKGSQRLFDDVFISENASRIGVANESAIGTILIAESAGFHDVTVGADLVLTEQQFVLLVENKFYGGLHGEAFIFPSRDVLPGYDRNATMRAWPIKFRTGHAYVPTAYSYGRYLRMNDDLQKRHLYTKYLKRAKYQPQDAADTFGTFLAKAIPRVINREMLQNPIITWAPQKPSDPFDRGQILLSQVNRNRARNEQLDIRDCLNCPADFPSQKTQGTFAERRANVSGKFNCFADLQGHDVILFDDIYTSGSTLRECAKMLKDAGAGDVVAVTLGIACHESVSTVPQLSCELCGADLELRFRGGDLRPFWSCPNWNSGPQRHPGVPFKVGIERIRALQKKLDDDTFGF